MVETRSTSNNAVPKMSTSSSDSPDGAMLTQQSTGTSTAIKSNEQKRLETSKLMIENDIIHTDYLITAIESSEDIETLEETANEIREIQQKLEPVFIDLISGLEPDEQDIMSREHSRLKIEIKQTLTLFRKHAKETKRPLQQTSSG